MYLENRKCKSKLKAEPTLVFFLLSTLSLTASLMFMNKATYGAFHQCWFVETTMEQVYILWETQAVWMTASMILFIMAVLLLIIAIIKESKL